MRRPVVGVVWLEEERRLSSALGHEPIRTPGIAVHRPDGKRGTACGKNAAHPVKKASARFCVERGIVADDAKALSRKFGRTAPPNRATSAGLLLRVDRRPACIGAGRTRIDLDEL